MKRIFIAAFILQLLVLGGILACIQPQFGGVAANHSAGTSSVNTEHFHSFQPSNDDRATDPFTGEKVGKNVVLVCGPGVECVHPISPSLYQAEMKAKLFGPGGQ